MNRLGVDVDGVLADFSTAYHEFGSRLLGADAARTLNEAAAPRFTPFGLRSRVPAFHAVSQRRPRGAADWSLGQRARIWQAIAASPDFWTTIPPLDQTAIARLYELAVAQRWDVLFLTRRLPSDGEAVQRQTQRWLSAHGFPLASVIIMPGSRGRLAETLSLDVVVDDSLHTCLDVVADSRSTAVLVSRCGREVISPRVKGFGIATVSSMHECLDCLMRTESSLREGESFRMGLRRALGVLDEATVEGH